MERLGYDELTYIFSKVTDADDRRSFSQVSKHNLRVACIRLLKLKILSFPYMLYMKILPASINLVSLECGTHISNTYMELLAQSCSNLKYLKLSSDSEDLFHTRFDFDDDGLCAIANGCTHLCEVDLSWRLGVGDVGVVAIVRSSRNTLTSLNLCGCVNVTNESLKAIGESSCLKSLNLQGCHLITDWGLEYYLAGQQDHSDK
ncbi:Leucine-rich repeat, cysteine-containing subtype [Artemisia annua]|uniref:Leucine-rich repeat, cysteine-containing subtype n=1 Tax=Artemisia annua TaxID=35608 RepID=A0A2U1K9Y5_ARTAN|nr:Leucine-rich repeat, cysteine-containing subtype [Artemisia annua]